METASHQIDHRDSFGKRVAVQTAMLGVLLSIFTICAHRAHTETIAMKNEESNRWSYYQAKRIRDHQIEMNADLLRRAVAPNAETEKLVAKYEQQRVTYRQELADIKKDAEEKAHKGAIAHHKAWYFDLAEGVLEISMVLSSLYFLSRRKLFPAMGLAGGVAGLVLGVIGMLTH